MQDAEGCLNALLDDLVLHFRVLDVAEDLSGDVRDDKFDVIQLFHGFLVEGFEVVNIQFVLHFYSL